MSMPKKGSRCVDVEGEVFRWRIRKRSTYLQLAYGTALAISIQNEKRTGAILLVLTPQSRPDNMINLEPEIVTPAKVADYIRQALSAGWNPHQPGELFVLNMCKSGRR